MKPVRTTIIFGMLSACCVLPFTYLLGPYWGWTATHKIFLSLILGLYTLLLCRWSKTDILAITFPALLMIGLALIPSIQIGFILAALCIFNWIRSGICFSNTPLRAVVGEVVTVTGGAGFIFFWWSHSTLIFPLAIWFFFLVQTLYFFIVPQTAKGNRTHQSADPFEQASQDMERLFENSR